jgi:hypothetical protein
MLIVGCPNFKGDTEGVRAMRSPWYVVALFLAAATLTKADEQAVKPAKLHCLDLQSKANTPIAGQFTGDSNGEGKLVPGEHTFEGVKFKVGAKYLQLGSTMQPNGTARIADVKVDRVLAKLHLLHATGWSTDDGTIIGEYVVTWEDDTSVTIPIRYGKELLDWWYDDASAEPSEAKVAWKGVTKQSEASGKKVRLYLATWENPKPDKKIKTIDFTTSKQSPCAPFCVAITAEDK